MYKVPSYPTWNKVLVCLIQFWRLMEKFFIRAIRRLLHNADIYHTISMYHLRQNKCCAKKIDLLDMFNTWVQKYIPTNLETWTNNRDFYYQIYLDHQAHQYCIYVGRRYLKKMTGMLVELCETGRDNFPPS